MHETRPGPPGGSALMGRARSTGGRATLCLACGGEFRPRKRGHVFCSSLCRHRGPRRPEQPTVDHDAIARLFDEGRDPDARVRDNDWYPQPPTMKDLDAHDTVAERRRWFLELSRRGRA